MDMEIEAPVDDLEALFEDENDEEMLIAGGTTKPSNNPLAC